MVVVFYFSNFRPRTRTLNHFLHSHLFFQFQPCNFFYQFHNPNTYTHSSSLFHSTLHWLSNSDLFDRNTDLDDCLFRRMGLWSKSRVNNTTGLGIVSKFEHITHLFMYYALDPVFAETASLLSR